MILLAPKERNSFQAEYRGALQNYNGAPLNVTSPSYFAPLGLALRGGVTPGALPPAVLFRSFRATTSRPAKE